MLVGTSRPAWSRPRKPTSQRLPPLTTIETPLPGDAAAGSWSAPATSRDHGISSVTPQRQRTLLGRIKRMSRELIESWTTRGASKPPQSQQPPPQEEEQASESQIIMMLREYDEKGAVACLDPETTRDPASCKNPSPGKLSPPSPLLVSAAPLDATAADGQQQQQEEEEEPELHVLSPERRGEFLSSLLDASLPPISYPRPTKKMCFLNRLAGISQEDPKRLARLLNEYDQDGNGELDFAEFGSMVQT